MGKQRRQRVAEEIKKEVSEIIRFELKDPGLGKMTSITDVEVSGDLRYTKIFVSIYANKEEQDKMLRVLHKAAGFIRTEIGKRIRLRHVPEIEFHLDHSMEYGARIDSVLKKLEPELGAKKQE